MTLFKGLFYAYYYQLFWSIISYINVYNCIICWPKQDPTDLKDALSIYKR